MNNDGYHGGYGHAPGAVDDVSTFRLYILRAMFLLITLGMGSIIWPLILNHRPWSVMHSVAACMLGALTVLTAFGVRYPLQFLPIMLFELAWKTIWIVAIALPAWRAHRIDAEMMETIVNTGAGVILCPLVIPWGYVYRNYFRKPGDRWRGRGYTADAI